MLDLSSCRLDSSHTSLLDWWFSTQPNVPSITQDAAFQISSILANIPFSDSLTSGFEFHHYDSTILPDYLVFLSSTDLSYLPSTSLPDWWPSYIEFLTSSSHDLAFSLIPENWLEFDFMAPNLVLNGLWQRVSEPSRSFDISNWHQLAGCISGGFISYEALASHPVITNLIQIFSLPQQIGLMHGRAHNLKLMFQLDSHTLIHNFHTFVNQSTSEISNIFSPISNYFLDHGLVLNPAISIDIDLRSKSLTPNNIAIEIHQPHQLGRNLLPESSNFIESILKVSESQLSSLSLLLRHLPYGESFSFTDSNSNFSTLSNISRLNHIKVQFRNHQWFLKSYVKLIQTLS